MLIRRSEARGQTRLSWLHSQHTFSFGGYFEPNFMGFGNLRVINQDVVRPGAGFGQHGHRDMEIISVVMSGRLEHRDTYGHHGLIEPGEVQVMSAGHGIAHSEYNASETDPVEFYQIWIQPNEMSLAPRYQQAKMLNQPGLQRLVSEDGREGSLRINQVAELSRLRVSESHFEFRPRLQRLWLQLYKGSLSINGYTLNPGDGVALAGHQRVQIEDAKDVDALLINVE